MSIAFNVDDVDFQLNDSADLSSWITAVISNSGARVGNINYLFCSDQHLLKVNQQYLGHDTYTDIITFDYVTSNLISGDIMISVERVADNALSFDVPFDVELRRVLIHGILHLLGQGDKSDADAAIMRQKEDEALDLFISMFHKKRDR